MFRFVGYVIVFVHNMDSMLDFWKNQIGVPVKYSSNDWSELQLENVILALHKSMEATPKDTGIVFIVEDIEKTIALLRERGVDVTNPQDIGVGLEATFKDPEGNIYRIFQQTRNA